MKKRRRLKRRVEEPMITYYGYSDGSGEYYIIIDTDKCCGCGKCVEKCAQSVLKLETIFVDLEDKIVASVKEDQRKKIKYTCSSCKPETNCSPCVLSCEGKAIRCLWKPQ